VFSSCRCRTYNVAIDWIMFTGMSSQFGVFVPVLLNYFSYENRSIILDESEINAELFFLFIINTAEHLIEGRTFYTAIVQAMCCSRMYVRSM